MLYREVPKNGDKLSVLGYGCMRLPVRMQSINENLAERQILDDQTLHLTDEAGDEGQEEVSACFSSLSTGFSLPSILINSL